ncbi:unnamed protein product, partial [Clonostachys rosea]
WLCRRISARRRARVGCAGSCESTIHLVEWRLVLLTSESSIREFVNLSIPVFMFDKNEDFVVMTMEEVGLGPAAHVLWAGSTASPWRSGSDGLS